METVCLFTGGIFFYRKIIAVELTGASVRGISQNCFFQKRVLDLALYFSVD